MAERRSFGPRKNLLVAPQESGEDPLTLFERRNAYVADTNR